MRSFLPVVFLLVHVLAKAASPTAASSNLTFNSIEGSSFNLFFTKGDGAGRIIVVRKAAPVQFVPVNGAAYTANNNFGIGSPVGDGEYVVYNGTGNAVSVYDLLPNTLYYVAVYEYNGSGTTTEYLATALAGNHATATPPTVAASNIVFSNLSGNSDG
ncbi:hypothetical protein [Flavisolibacter nicotianae]|uniref:hypothetical protein n=1 Tax=Flavisolibacter nicotianae TaxID=2364882 RepID=UPI000EABE4B6|nr:hypothetical protein [Flavisolibacter nicotianae]